LDEAIKYCQSCLQIREQYGEAARLRNDTRFKGEEFARLDAVHLQEIEAGIYSLPWEEAANETAGLKTALTEAELQQKTIEEMKTDGELDKEKIHFAVLSKAKIEDSITKSAFITRQLATTKDKVEEAAKVTGTYRSGIEVATWIENLAAAKSSVAQLGARLKIAQRKEEYFRKDEGFKSQRAAISRQLAWLQISEHCRQGSELNYDEKLQNLKALFGANRRHLVERVIVLAVGLKESYGLDLPLDAPSTGSILDHVSVWLVSVQDELSKFKRAQRLTIVSKWGVGIALGPKNDSGLSAFNVEFIVDKVDLPSGNALLRGVAFEYEGKNQRPITFKVLPPQNASVGSRPHPVLFGRVCPLAPNRELMPQHADFFWNGSAIGTWSVDGIVDTSAGPIDNAVMHMWVVSV